MRATDVALATQRPRTCRSATCSKARSRDQAGRRAVAAVEIALDGQGRILATVTCLAVDELGLGEGDHVYALIKTVAIDERPLG